MSKDSLPREEIHKLAGDAISDIIDLMGDIENSIAEVTEKIQKIQEGAIVSNLVQPKKR